MLNVVALVGRLTADPVLKYTQNGISVTAVRLAVDRNHVRTGEQRQADFIDVVCWRQTAEFVCKYFQKGSWLAVNGSLQTRQYTDKAGNNRMAVEVVADNVSFAGSKAAPAPAPAPATVQVIASQDVQQMAMTMPHAPTIAEVYGIGEPAEDLPF